MRNRCRRKYQMNYDDRALDNPKLDDIKTLKEEKRLKDKGNCSSVTYEENKRGNEGF